MKEPRVNFDRSFKKTRTPFWENMYIFFRKHVHDFDECSRRRDRSGGKPPGKAKKLGKWLRHLPNRFT